jgi:hypothetical protein
MTSPQVRVLQLRAQAVAASLSNKKRAPAFPRHRRRWVPSLSWHVLLATGGAVLALSWIADALKGEVLFPWAGFDSVWPGLAVGMLVFYGCSVVVHRLQKSPIRTLEQRPATPHRGIIFFLAPSKQRVICKEGSLHIEHLDLTGRNLVDAIQGIQHAGIRWPWQQILRGLATHLHKVRAVYLMGSPGEHGSHGQTDLAASVIAHFAPGVRVISGPAVDFENVQELLYAIFTAIHRLRSECGLSDKDVIVDVTGGQKTTSIAGALITLNSSDITFQYVQTNPDYEVLSYNLKFEPLPST